MVDPSQMGGGGGMPSGGPGGPGGAPGGAPGGQMDPAALLALAKLARRKRHPGSKRKGGKKRK